MAYVDPGPLTDPLGLLNGTWRYFELDPGGGGGVFDPVFDPGPLGPSDPPLGTPLGPEWQPAPPPPPPSYYPAGRGPSAPAPAPPPAPVDHRWDGIAAGYKAELEDLALQWQQMSGFAAAITEDALRGMADQHIVSLRDMGMWIWQKFGWAQFIGSMPWLAFGMDQTAWRRQVGDYQDAIERQTGQRPEFQLADGVNPGDPWSQMIWDAMKAGTSQSGLTEKLLHDDNIRNQYGWIKFGLTFDDFQQRKVDMRVAFGQDLSNDQALLQLQEMHQARGENRAVTAPGPRQQEPVTVSEVTVR